LSKKKNEEPLEKEKRGGSRPASTPLSPYSSDTRTNIGWKREKGKNKIAQGNKKKSPRVGARLYLTARTAERKNGRENKTTEGGKRIIQGFAQDWKGSAGKVQPETYSGWLAPVFGTVIGR